MLNKNLKKLFPAGVRQNNCSANMQSYRRTPTWKCDFGKIGLHRKAGNGMADASNIFCIQTRLDGLYHVHK